MRLGRVQHLVPALVLLFPVLTSAGQSESGPTSVPCREPVSTLRNGVFNFRQGRVRLKDGRGCIKVQPEGPECEWSVELTRAETWGAGGRLLLAVINLNHEVGSGAFDSVLLYACDRDTFVRVWSHTYLYGATIVMGRASDLWITSGVWRQNDAMCCPSQERREHLAWDGAARSVVVLASEITTRRPGQ
jgi:hypothetical protein